MSAARRLITALAVLTLLPATASAQADPTTGASLDTVLDTGPTPAVAAPRPDDLVAASSVTVQLAPDRDWYAPGQPVRLSGRLVSGDATGAPLSGVPGRFTLALQDADGRVRWSGPVSAGADGRVATTIPGQATAGLRTTEGTGFARVLRAVATDVTAGGGATVVDEAGATAVTVRTQPDELILENSFVSSVGWVKPGDTYPFRVFVRNDTFDDATGVQVTIPAPPSATFTAATPLNGSGDATLTDAGLTWTIGSLPAATEAGPSVATLVVEARAASLAQDPEVVWKDLSSTATLTYDGLRGAPVTSASHGPKVIPPDGRFDTARYGDKPFPVVPVEYVDRAHKRGNNVTRLDTVINSPDFDGSTFNLYQEMSYGQLYPYATIPSEGIATAGWDYEPGFAFTTPEAGTNRACRGATLGSAPQLIGTPAFPERVKDGWYQLPGNTEYYGGDFPAFDPTLVVGKIDSACGQTGKAVFDAAQIADPEIDYNQFDSDKDGVVDFFMMIFVGCGGNGGSQLATVPATPATNDLCSYDDVPYDNIWPHSSTLEMQYKDPATGLRGYVSDDQLTSIDGTPQCWTDDRYLTSDDCASAGGTGDDELPTYVRVGPYNVNPETVFDSASVISHEYGHHLGLPDYYSSDELYGSFNLMAADFSQNMTVFSKQDLGWVVPDVLQPGEERTVDDWQEIKRDTGEIHWQTPSGEPYTLSADNGDQNVHNGQAFAAKLPQQLLIEPDKVREQASGTNVWWSGRGNDFGCSPTGAHNLDLALGNEMTSDAAQNAEQVLLRFKSSWDIEWDWDYGFVFTTPDGAAYTSQPSEMGYTTTNDYNPNGQQCFTEHDNGLTGQSGTWEQGQPAVTAERVSPAYADPTPFLDDEYDISELVGEDSAAVRFSYFTDAAFDRPGWFIDDVQVVAVDADGNETVLYSSDFEGTDDGHVFPGGCEGGLKTAVKCTDGFLPVDALEPGSFDKGYYLELRDRSGFDYDGHGQSERGTPTWDPGVLIEFTNEFDGYGNNGGSLPPAQHYLDSQPTPGQDCVSRTDSPCDDASFTAAEGDAHFSDHVTEAQPGGWVDNFTGYDDDGYDDDFWHFDYGCLSLDVLSMAGNGVGPEPPLESDLTADVRLTAAGGCREFAYAPGGSANTPPTAVASAGRTGRFPVGHLITFDGTGSSDAETAADGLTYAWDFGDGRTATGATVRHAYDESGTYEVTLTVTDPQGASSTDTVTVHVVGKKRA